MKPSPAKLSQSVALADLLVSRLERLSADSYWAHQASGVRGSLLRLIERYEQDSHLTDRERKLLERSIQLGYRLLALAAKEGYSSRKFCASKEHT
ncbi:MAG: hypothetical protein RML93_00100 [Anaerolineales bacterium]|nr:hypothetical protein [Anaerolineales bacterium]MCS7249233.1 hypothetical protein [Anaerolineales bacterium]MDW8163047.1 hypothetical protein [Anaerolineales bacterium]MDW8445671.1 hypothetical protein [Anaerolineales bacterium]